MTIAHLSDTHLGYVAYTRNNPKGLNQREIDVVKTFEAALRAIGERDPDLVVHSGDLFHRTRPSNHTLFRTFKLLSDFQERRRGRPFVLISGNHDSPRASDVGSPLNLFTLIKGMRVVVSGYEVMDLRDLDAEVLAVTWNHLFERTQNLDLVPTVGRRYAVLTLHGLASGLLGESVVSAFDEAEMRRDLWTYVALGDYHIHKAYGPNACYSGSTDFTTSNIWEETKNPKGWVWFDTEVGQFEFIPVQTRRVIDLPWIDASDLTPDEVGQRIYANAQWEDEMPIVRQIVANASAELERKVDYGIKRGIRERALHYDLQFRRRKGSLTGLPRLSDGDTIEAQWSRHIDDWTPPAGVKREEVRAEGATLLKEARADAVDPDQA